jgi:hypothetical protein
MEQTSHIIKSEVPVARDSLLHFPRERKFAAATSAAWCTFSCRCFVDLLANSSEHQRQHLSAICYSTMRWLCFFFFRKINHQSMAALFLKSEEGP